MNTYMKSVFGIGIGTVGVTAMMFFAGMFLWIARPESPAGIYALSIAVVLCFILAVIGIIAIVRRL
jgi:hypothetical protein